jgi:phage host-nuclease inhibitor protein Gam
MHRTRKPAAAVPQEFAVADRAVAELGRTRREIARLETEMNEGLALLKAGYERQAEPLLAREAVLLAGIEAYCAANRDRLTNGGKVKTIPFTSGSAKWRMRPPGVTIRAIEATIARLKEAGLTRFLRVKEEINREAILADPAAVAGIATIAVGSAGEDFIVEPLAEAFGGGDA